MPERMLVIDVNVVHALAATYLQGTVAAGKSAEVDGAAAAMGEHSKEEECRRDVDGGAYDWKFVVMQSGGWLGKGAMRVTDRLAKLAAGSDGVEKHVCVRRVQEALTVARVQGNGWVWKNGLQTMAYGGGLSCSIIRVWVELLHHTGVGSSRMFMTERANERCTAPSRPCCTRVAEGTCHTR